MILIVVLVHAVASHQKQVFKSIHIAPDFRETVVGAEISRIGLGHADHAGVQNIGLIDDADFGNFRLRKVNHFFIRQFPDVIRFVAEVLESNPGIARIAHQMRAPVVEDLHAAHLNIGFLNIDPVVL